MSRKTISRAPKILLSVFMTVGLLLLTGGLIWLFSCIKFRQTAVEIPGVISEISRYKGSDDEYHHNVYVSYEYGEKSYDYIPVNTYSSSMYEGQEITLYCDPSNPGKVRVVSMFYFGPVLLISVGLIFAGTSSGVLIFAAAVKLRREKLKKEGKILYAVVEQIVCNERFSVNGFHPYVIYCTYRDDYRDITYKFKSENIWFDPTSMLPADSIIEVRVDENDYSKYYVNVDDLNKKIVDYT